MASRPVNATPYDLTNIDPALLVPSLNMTQSSNQADLKSAVAPQTAASNTTSHSPLHCDSTKVVVDRFHSNPTPPTNDLSFQPAPKNSHLHQYTTRRGKTPKSSVIPTMSGQERYAPKKTPVQDKLPIQPSDETNNVLPGLTKHERREIHRKDAHAPPSSYAVTMSSTASAQDNSHGIKPFSFTAPTKSTQQLGTSMHSGSSATLSFNSQSSQSQPQLSHVFTSSTSQDTQPNPFQGPAFVARETISAKPTTNHMLPSRKLFQGKDFDTNHAKTSARVTQSASSENRSGDTSSSGMEHMARDVAPQALHTSNSESRRRTPSVVSSGLGKEEGADLDTNTAPGSKTQLFNTLALTDAPSAETKDNAKKIPSSRDAQQAQARILELNEELKAFKPESQSFSPTVKKALKAIKKLDQEFACKANRIDNLVKAMEILQKQVDNLEDEAKSLRLGNLEPLSYENTMGHPVGGSDGDSQDESAVLQAENTGLDLDNTTKSNTIEGLRQDLKKLQAEKDTLTLDNTTETNTNEGLREDIKKLQAEKDTLALENTTFIDTIEGLREDIKKLQAENATHVVDKKAKDETIQFLRKDVKMLEEQVNIDFGDILSGVGNTQEPVDLEEEAQNDDPDGPFGVANQQESSHQSGKTSNIADDRVPNVQDVELLVGHTATGPPAETTRSDASEKVLTELRDAKRVVDEEVEKSRRELEKCKESAAKARADATKYKQKVVDQDITIQRQISQIKRLDEELRSAQLLERGARRVFRENGNRIKPKEGLSGCTLLYLMNTTKELKDAAALTAYEALYPEDYILWSARKIRGLRKKFTMVTNSANNVWKELSSTKAALETAQAKIAELQEDSADIMIANRYSIGYHYADEEEPMPVATVKFSSPLVTEKSSASSPPSHSRQPAKGSMRKSQEDAKYTGARETIDGALHSRQPTKGSMRKSQEDAQYTGARETIDGDLAKIGFMLLSLIGLFFCWGALDIEARVLAILCNIYSAFPNVIKGMAGAWLVGFIYTIYSVFWVNVPGNAHHPPRRLRATSRTSPRSEELS